MVQIHRVTRSEMGRIQTTADVDPRLVFGKIIYEVPKSCTMEREWVEGVFGGRESGESNNGSIIKVKSG